MHQRSPSPHDFMKKINTERSECLPFSSRNSESNVFDYSIHKIKNTSQIVSKNDKKVDRSKPQSRKNSFSSFYFRNYNKNGKNTDTQSFSKYLKSKNQQLKPNRNNPKNQNRKRCITTINLTTKKDSQLFSTSKQKQKESNIKTQIDFFDNYELFCKNHPSKVAYFEALESNQCFCHQCSIECVKENLRLIQLCPEIKNAKKIVEKRLEQARKYGDQLCSLVEEKIRRNIDDLEDQYRRFKASISTQDFEKKTIDQAKINFELRSIDWSFLEQISLNLDSKITQLSFLEPKKQIYSLKMAEKQESEAQNITIQEFNQEFEMSPVALIDSSMEKERVEKLWNFNPKPKKNLIQEIENALNYQSRRSKNMRVKTISLRNDKNSDKTYQNYLNQENMEPNILMDQNNSLVS